LTTPRYQNSGLNTFKNVGSIQWLFSMRILLNYVYTLKVEMNNSKTYLALIVINTLCVLTCNMTFYSQNNSYTNYNIQQKDSTSLLLDSAKILFEENPSKSIDLINRSLESSILNRNTAGEAQSYIALAQVQRKLKRYLQAEESLLRCKKLLDTSKGNSTNTKDSQGPSESLRFECVYELVLVYEESNKLDKALLESELSQTLLSSASNVTKRNNAIRNHGRLFSKLGRSNEAIAQFNTLLKSERDAGDKGGESETLISISEHYMRKGENIQAKSYLSASLDISKANQFNEKTLRANGMLANLFNEEGDFANELDVRNFNVTLSETTQDDATNYEQNIAIGNAYIRSDNLVLAEHFVESGIEKINRIDNTGIRTKSEEDRAAPIPNKSTNLQLGADAYRLLAESYLKKNELSKSLELYKKYAILQDSVQVVHARELSAAIELSNNFGKSEQRLELLEKERELSEQSISLLQQDQELKSGQIFNRNLIIGLLIGLLLILAIVGLIITKTNKARRTSDKLLALQSMSGQMNPHFIFNALNSVNEYISQNDERQANRYLTSFSKLMRQVMDDSKHTFIPLTEEIEMLRLYLDLEHARFKDQFEYSFYIDDKLLNSDFELPPMMVQPFIENAIWHGLRYRSGGGSLNIHFSAANGSIEILISDNGIGIQKSKELKTIHQKKQNSMGMKNIYTRISLMNEIYNIGMAVNISEQNPGNENPGTLVKMLVPQRENKSTIKEHVSIAGTPKNLFQQNTN